MPGGPGDECRSGIRSLAGLALASNSTLLRATFNPYSSGVANSPLLGTALSYSEKYRSCLIIHMTKLL